MLIPPKLRGIWRYWSKSTVGLPWKILSDSEEVEALGMTTHGLGMVYVCGAPLFIASLFIFFKKLPRTNKSKWANVHITTFWNIALLSSNFSPTKASKSGASYLAKRQ